MQQQSVQHKVIRKRNHFTILGGLTANADDEAMQEITTFIRNLL